MARAGSFLSCGGIDRARLPPGGQARRHRDSNSATSKRKPRIEQASQPCRPLHRATVTRPFRLRSPRRPQGSHAGLGLRGERRTSWPRCHVAAAIAHKSVAHNHSLVVLISMLTKHARLFAGIGFVVLSYGLWAAACLRAERVLWW